ncbi:kelch repeat protein [Colletotrichum karsti]|uniref:Kelch repeat protein n=1 Tax=Colletotrichum karsti TaxID=1095194 RepID=A0A9P6IIY6_9PEZI|nr:kelch repeat protein [Colletotrichum karsti]KAF9880630.1 kelch repeat protein [Colletotrichum karsti]
MARISATWTQIASGERLRRSSQAVSVLGNHAYIFGGELIARQPVDSQIDVVELKAGQDSASIETLPASSSGPSPRVGSPSTVLGDAFYIFSGRGGLAMEPVEENGGLWRFTPSGNKWDFIKAEMKTHSPFPAGRSYHCIATDGADHIFVHAGCPEKGRLADLWSFNVTSKTWVQLPDAPLPARGGPSIAYYDGKIYRMNGFDGKTERGGAVDIFNLTSQTWSTFSFGADGIDGPEARSVSAVLTISIQGKAHLVTLFGERDPSSLGHAGAGKMLEDVWAFDIEGQTWSKVDTQGTPPAPRGWFDADATRDAVIVHGGLAEDNSRLGDIWELKFI